MSNTQYLCSGADGASGLSTLVVVSEEPVDAHCAVGGKKISAGLDANRNGILDAGEVTSIGYLCNGVNGQDGTEGQDGSVSLIKVT